MTIHKVGNQQGKILRTGLGVNKNIIATPSSDVIQSTQTSRLRMGLGRNVVASSSGGEGFLFLDDCQSSSLPSGVTTSGTLQYATGKRYFTDNGTYNIPSAGNISIPQNLVTVHKASNPLESFLIVVSTNGIQRYMLAYQSDRNIVVYRLPDYGLVDVLGRMYDQNETWKTDIFISNSRFGFLVQNNNATVIAQSTGLFFTPSPSDSVVFSYYFYGTTELLYSHLIKTPPFYFGASIY